jgi:hypothetical protein
MVERKENNPTFVRGMSPSKRKENHITDWLNTNRGEKTEPNPARTPFSFESPSLQWALLGAADYDNLEKIGLTTLLGFDEFVDNLQRGILPPIDLDGKTTVFATMKEVEAYVVKYLMKKPMEKTHMKQTIMVSSLDLLQETFNRSTRAQRTASQRSQNYQKPTK